MKEFLNKFTYIHITNSENKDLFYCCVLITNVTDIHISFIDDYNCKPYCYRIIDIAEIKPSTKTPIHSMEELTNDNE